jgi:hypothetical protein
MNCVPTYEAPTSAEEQVGIRFRQVTDGVESMTVHGDGNMRRKGRILIKDMPVGMMVHRHDTSEHYSIIVTPPSFEPSNHQI